MVKDMDLKDVVLSYPQMDVYYARTPLVLDMAGQGSGKTENIGVQTIEVIEKCPQIKGFIGANTYNQISQSTLTKAFAAWAKYKGWIEFDKENPDGCYVVDKKPPAHFKKYHKLKNYHNTISFDNGCLIFTGSLDNYKAHDGKEFGWAHLDETKDTAKEALTTVIFGRLRQLGLYYDMQGEILYHEDKAEAAALGYTPFNPCYIHTSPSFAGTEWLIEMFELNQGERQNEIKQTLLDTDDYYLLRTEDITAVIYQTYWNEQNLPEGWIERKTRKMTSDEILMFIYGYPFSRTGNEYYPEWDAQKHVVKRIPVDYKSRLYLAYDFNVMPYVTQLAAQIDNVVKYYNETTGEKVDFLEPHHEGFKAISVMRFKFFKEFCMRPPYNETEQAADAAGRYWQLNDGTSDIAVYGDASGHNRITGFPSLTQYKVIKRILQKYFAADIKAKKANISVLMRKKLMNKIFAGVFPEIELYVAADCEELIRDFNLLKQAPEGGKHKEKKKDENTGLMYEVIGHTSDAAEGLICEVLRSYLKYID